MASLSGAHPASLKAASDQLASEIEQMQLDLERSIEVAGIKNDPILPLVRVLGASLGLQSRLLNQSISYFRDSSERLDRQYSETIKQAELALEAKRTAIIDQLTPKLAGTVDHAVRQKIKIIKLKTILSSLAVVLLIFVAGGMATYASGFSAGRLDGEIAAHMVQTAMATGPADGAAWATLMQYNDGAEALAICRKGISADADGRRYCFMPVWLDPPQGMPTRQ